MKIDQEKHFPDSIRERPGDGREYSQENARRIEQIDLILPWPISVNRYWRCVNNRIVISKDGRQYHESAKRAIAGQWHGQPLSGRIRLRLKALQKDRRRRDLDNLLKATMDALTTAEVWLDDSQVDDLQIIRELNPSGGYLMASISEIGNER